MSDQNKSGLRLHWKSLAACSLISMSPFQYGVDYTLIGGFQAMVGFLKLDMEVDHSVVYNIRFSDTETPLALQDGTFPPSASSSFLL
ncbi:Maltose permease [Penicillium verhagenii]|nr:Maltose permease [Penicillium verhagenii]